jgi:quercetin dioxygenase-like cupin family protein
MQDWFTAGVRPAELGAEQRERLRRRMLEQAREQAPEGTCTLRADEAVWIQIAPFVEVRELRRDEVSGTHTSLMRMHPGGVVPAHRHAREEEFIILEGECQIGTHKLVAGDVHIAAAGSWHEPVTTRTGVLVLLRGEYPHPTPAA